MGIWNSKKENQEELKESSYRTRQNYLQTMKQFMASDIDTPQSQTQGDLEEYFLYEKEVSCHIQKLLEQFDSKAV